MTTNLTETTTIGDGVAVQVGDLENLIESAQKRLAEVRAQGFVADQRKQQEREIDACKAAIDNSDQTISKFILLIGNAAEAVDVAIEAQFSTPSIGIFGAPLLQQDKARTEAAAQNWLALKQALFQHRRSRALQVSRLQDLLRVRGQSAT